MAIQAQMYQDYYGLSFGGSQYLMANTFGLNEFCSQKQEQSQVSQHKVQSTNFEINNGQSRDFPHYVADQVEVQRQEVDRIISLQNARLRMVLQKQRKQQMELVLMKYKAKMEDLMRQKDQEIANALNRKIELENFLRKMEFETQTWQRVAMENESKMEHINNTIEQLRESIHLMNEAEDSESFCASTNEDNERGENTRNGIGGENEIDTRSGKSICRCCNFQKSSIVFLPCRHLCACKSCESFLQACPLCGFVKKASIEVLF